MKVCRSTRPTTDIDTGIKTDCPSDTRHGHPGRAGTQKAAACVDTCS